MVAAGVALAAVLLPAGCGDSTQSKALADVVRGAQTARLNVEEFPASYRVDGNAGEVMQPLLDRVEAAWAGITAVPCWHRACRRSSRVYARHLPLVAAAELAGCPA